VNAHTAEPRHQHDRDHRDLFAVHAIDIDKLEVGEDVSPGVVGFNLTFHVLARAVIRSTFKD
jgi:phosphatidylethanolamine-binding protein (PEBP) family uncharacterized protein